MTARREAFTLPVLFLTVALLGGLRIADRVRLVPPPLAALVLGMLLFGALIRARVLNADALMNAARRPLENANGAVVLFSLFAASTQMFNLLVPERGLYHAIFAVFFGVQLLTSLAAIEERRRMLRALAVLFGSAFVLRFIVLETLYGADPTALKRILTVLLEGVTLGALEYQSHSTATGYTAFAALALYMIGLALLAPPSAATGLQRRAPEPGTLPTRALVLLCLMVGAAGLALARTPLERAEPRADAGGGPFTRPMQASIRARATNCTVT